MAEILEMPQERETGNREKGKKARGKKKRRWPAVLLVLFLIIIGLPLLCVGLSFIGRISPGDVIPDSFVFYVRIPNPVQLSERFLAHEPLPEILSSPVFSPALPLLRDFEESGVTQNPLVRFAARGVLEGALLDGGRFLAAWDSGILAPFLRLLPALSGTVTIPGLYYVQAGKYSRFEYRFRGRAESAGADADAEPKALFIAPYHNLLVISTDAAFLESVLDGTSREGDVRGSRRKEIGRETYDAAVLLAPEFLAEMLNSQDPVIASALESIEFPSPVELTVSIEPKQLSVSAAAPVLARNDAVQRIIERNSTDPSLASFLPSGAQYATVLSAGPLRDLMEAMRTFSGDSFTASLRRADASSRGLLGLSLEDLLYSWTGEEFAVFGMEGRPAPVYAIQIRDEEKRREIFNKAFSSIVLTEDISLNLDGMRIPQIRLPGFFASLIQLWGMRIPAPYYTVEGGYLFVSESAETILAAVRGIQKNDSLLKTAAWQGLAHPENSRGAFTIYYSLDRSLPFFLRGNTLLSSVFGLYRQGLLQMGFEKGEIRFSLSVNPGSGQGLYPAQGYPLAIAGKTGNRVYSLTYNRGGSSRIFLTRDTFAVAVNPADQKIYELEAGSPPWVIPAEGQRPRSPEEGSVWVVTAQGRVILANGNMETMRGFPLATGLRLSAPPVAANGKLFLSDEDGKVHIVDGKGSRSQWETVFPAALRAPPSFAEEGGLTRAAVYPKRFLGDIWLLDEEGNALSGWPVPVNGIAFGSPLLFTAEAGPSSGGQGLFAAFITQAGELTVYNERAEVLPGFPLELSGIFYLQPVWDGQALWLISEDGVLFQVTPGGQALWQRIPVPNLLVKEEGYITASDVDGDTIPEIFFSGEGNALYGYTRGFSSLDGFPLPVWGQPSFADLNGDGKSECTGAGLDNRLYRWHFR
ncbi:MAG: VCBS repeat-containing protein [Treponema sp.]|nr:VCBS repeat-containing protein [Treponema sp.]